MLLAPDFFDYFAAAATLIDQDSSLYCASAWNDNGMGHLVHDTSALRRTDCFPGLGWMMSGALWDEFRDKWPTGFWDDWMRLPENRNERSCIMPEVNRVYTFGEGGSSGGQFWNQFLKNIRLNKVKTPFRAEELTYLLSDQYDERVRGWIRNATEEIPIQDAVRRIRALPHGQGKPDSSDTYVVRYNSLKQLDTVLQPLGLMTDHKAGVPRTSYKGVISFRFQQRNVPPSPLAVPTKPGLPAHPLDEYGYGYRILLVPTPDHSMAGVTRNVIA
eukprot:TRINITY_DN66595_c5_g5_i7.p3 TRINITY_DN66595_c5_g5~~TRINITY_DN66595_c5_g5_i7.p3  ORF type:complete len:273 (+),score=125.45 TRINITY_DN66595_c5_g5_i7:886-1704(+)